MKQGPFSFLFSALGMGLALVIGACSTQQRQAEGAYRFFRAHPLQLATLCADQYPVRSEYKRGAETIRTDTLFMQNEQIIPCPPPAAGQKNSFVKCPPHTQVIQRISRTDTLFRENTARVSQLSTQLEQCRAQVVIFRKIIRQAAWLTFILVLGFFCWISIKQFLRRCI